MNNCSIMQSLAIFVQLAVEALPISSSSHVLLILNIFKASNISTLIKNTTLFNIVSDITPIIIFRKEITDRLFFKKYGKHILKMLGIATLANLITAILLMFFSQKLSIFYKSENFMIFNLIYSCFIVFSTFFKKSKEISPAVWWHGVLLGAAQGMSSHQGISRLGVTITTALWLGLSSADTMIISYLMHLELSLANLLWFLVSNKELYLFVKSLINVWSFLALSAGILASFLTTKLTIYLIKKNLFFIYALAYIIPFFLWFLNEWIY